jgi:hypothetical protein
MQQANLACSDIVCVHALSPALPLGDSLLLLTAAALGAVGLLLLPSWFLYAGMLLRGLLLAVDCECMRCAARASSTLSNPLRSCR